MRIAIQRLLAGTVLLLSSARGDVLMEYVVLTLLVVAPLIGVSEGVFDPTGKGFDIQGLAEGNVDNFGFVGQWFVYRWRMIMCGVGLPLP